MIDFRKIKTRNLDGEEVVFDISKELGNTNYKNTPDLGELDFAQEIYKKGKVEVTEERADMVRRYLDAGRFLAFIKRAVNEELDKLLTNKKQ